MISIRDDSNGQSGTIASPARRSKTQERDMSDKEIASTDSETEEQASVSSSGLRSDLSEMDTVNKIESRSASLPTLPQFDTAEALDENCWSEPGFEHFKVRGQHYFQDGKKVKSDSYLLRARGCDLFLSDHPHDCIIGKNVQGALGGLLRSESTFLVRLTFPWGILVQYYSVPDSVAPFMRSLKTYPPLDGLSVSEQVLAKWFMGGDDYKNQRLKLIPHVVEGPWVVRHLVGKPTVIGKKLPVLYKYNPPNPDTNEADFLVCDLDIGSSSKTAKKIVSVCRKYLSALTVDIGFVIQAETQEELPEQMLGCVRMHKLDTLKAPSLSV